MTSADFCSGLKEDYSSPQSISVARTSQDTEQISPDKTVSGRCTSAAFTRSPDSQDFVLLCQLVPGKSAFYAVRVPRLATRSPASLDPTSR